MSAFNLLFFTNVHKLFPWKEFSEHEEILSQLDTNTCTL